MKNISFILLFITFTSCSLLKNNYNPVQEFLKTKISAEEEIIIVRNKVSNERAVRILFGSEKHSYDYKNTVPLENHRSKFIESKDWNTLYSLYLSDTIKRYWDRKDFPDSKFIFENRKGLWNSKFLDTYSEKEKKIFWASHPIWYKEKGYIIFYYSIETSTVPGGNERFVIIMKNTKEKWTVIDKVADYELY
jgi:hypothetical protein